MLLLKYFCSYKTNISNISVNYVLPCSKLHGWSVLRPGGPRDVTFSRVLYGIAKHDPHVKFSKRESDHQENHASLSCVNNNKGWCIKYVVFGATHPLKVDIGRERMYSFTLPLHLTHSADKFNTLVLNGP